MTSRTKEVNMNPKELWLAIRVSPQSMGVIAELNNGILPNFEHMQPFSGGMTFYFIRSMDFDFNKFGRIVGEETLADDFSIRASLPGMFIVVSR
jgi:hypothetical protein